MSMFFLALYCVVLICQIVMFIKNIRRPTKNGRMRSAILAVAAPVFALTVLVYYNSLPTGMFGGLEYIGEVLFSMAALIAYIITALVTAVYEIVMHLKEAK